MSIATLFIFLVGFLGGLYVLKLIFEDPTKKKKSSDKNGRISMDDEESYSFGSEEEPRNRPGSRHSSS